jgi:hypothetical protein
MDKQQFSIAMRAMLARPVAYHPAIAKMLVSAMASNERGKAGKAIIATLWLSQLIYWTDRGEDPDGWIYKKSAEWEAELSMERNELEAARNLLIDLKIVEFKKRGLGNVCHYRVNFEQLSNWLCDTTANRFATQQQTALRHNSKPLCDTTAKPNVSPFIITESTTKTTAETTHTCDDHADYFKPAKKSKQLTGEQLKIKQAMSIFASLASLNENFKWAKEIAGQLKICGGDLTKWQGYAEQVVQFMKNKGLTYTKPSSISWGIEKLVSGQPLDGRKAAVVSQADDEFAAELKRRRGMQQ